GAAVDERQDPGGGTRALRNEARRRPPEAEERLLYRVLGELLVAKDPQRQPVRRPAEAVVELAERSLVAPLDERDERLVREVGEISTQRLLPGVERAEDGERCHFRQVVRAPSISGSSEPLRHTGRIRRVPRSQPQGGEP